MALHNKEKVLSFINPTTQLELLLLNDLSGLMYNYNPEEILLYLYKESSPELTMSIEEDLKKNWALREKLAVMKTAMERLNNLTVSPRTEIVLNILRYAQKKEVSTTSS